jgi:hypothetical protein
MLVASVCNPNSLLVPEAEVLEFTSTLVKVVGEREKLLEKWRGVCFY